MSRAVLWTGGCGDVIALESTWSDQERDELSTCYWATRAAGMARPLFERSGRYSRVQHVVVPCGRKSYWNLHGLRRDHPDFPADVEDWSVLVRFQEFTRRPWSRSTFLVGSAEPADHLRLPDRFVAVQHETTLHADASQRRL